MIKIIDIPQEIVNEIQRKDVEMCSRKDIITFMLSKNMAVSTDNFDKYQNDYAKAFLAFEEIKHNIESKYVDPNMKDNEKKISWTLDYHTNELNIIYEVI